MTEASQFCTQPFIYNGRVAPCLIEPILSGVFFCLSFILYVYGRRASKRHQYSRVLSDDVEESPMDSGQSTARYGKAMWQLRISRFLVIYTLILASLQFIVFIAQTSMNDNSSDFYVISSILTGFSWLLLHFYFCLFCENSVYLDSPMVIIVTYVCLSDCFNLFTRVSMLYHPSDKDPLFISNQLILDICLVSIRLLLEVSFLVVGIVYRGQIYQPAPGEGPSHISAFSNFFQKAFKLWKFIWPKENSRLQILVFICVLLLIAARFVNFYVPLQYKVLVDQLMPGADGKVKFPLTQVLIFAALKLLQGSSGLLDSVRSTFWIPIEQYTTREVSIEMYRHLHSLSLRWHLNRKTGEVLRVMDRGTQAITSLLSYIFFNIVPVLVDIGIAVIYFILAFDITFGLIVLATMTAYLVATIWITEWRTKYRRVMIELDNKTNYKAVDALINFETVKYYGNEDFELRNYRQCIQDYQKADWQSQLSLKILNSVQNFIISLGFLLGSLLCVKRIVDGQLRVGDFILFVTYLQQLYMPLNWFGTYYRMINQNFIDMEKMMDLMNEQIEVKDIENAPDLIVKRGHIVFDDVCFTYDPLKATSPTLRNISFEILPGQTVALCGPSGSGKSSIVRLLFRFYDVSSGRITIDGQDISQVSQKSLRKAIGVVPQDTVLFNDTLIYNIRYGKTDAADSEVLRSAEMAQVHDKVMTFPEQYNTQVGERGLRLSGGEKQRIAIARTLLKDPPIVLLDEATSALDSNTERLIQQELSKMTKERTTLVVAHRLSTIVNADLILVVKAGEIVERGKHDQLLKQRGLYHEMWSKQKQDE